MKALSVKQPWASLICAGIKDMENRTWKPDEIPGRILIHAGSAKVTKDYYVQTPQEYISYVSNNIFWGNIPQLDSLPTGAIIGYVTVTGFEEGYTGAIWDQGSHLIKWKLEDAWLFDEPILNVKGQLRLFDYDLDETNLPPAHQVELECVEVLDNGEDVVIPTFKNPFEELGEGDLDYFDLYLTDDLKDLLCNQDGEEDVMKPFKTVTLIYGDKYKKFELKDDSGVYYIPDPNDEEQPIEIEYHDGHWGIWQVVGFSLGKKLDEGELVCLDDSNLITEFNINKILSEE